MPPPGEEIRARRLRVGPTTDDLAVGTDAMRADAFGQLIHQVRAGDPVATRTLVDKFQPGVCRVIKRWLFDARVRAALDPLDISQEVFAAFFTQVAAGEFDLDTPDQLKRLLVGIARRQFTAWLRREGAARRDFHRTESDDTALDLPALDPTPIQQAQEQELLRVAWDQLTPEEQTLVTWRLEGKDWAEIGKQLGERPAAVRKRHSRIVARIVRKLGLDEK